MPVSAEVRLLSLLGGLVLVVVVIVVIVLLTVRPENHSLFTSNSTLQNLPRGGLGRWWQTAVVRKVDQLRSRGDGWGGRGSGRRWRRLSGGLCGLEPRHSRPEGVEGGLWPAGGGEPGGGVLELGGGLVSEDLDPGRSLGGHDGQPGRKGGGDLLHRFRPGLGSGWSPSPGAEPGRTGSAAAVHDGLECGGRGAGLLPHHLPHGLGLDLGGGPGDGVGVPHPVSTGPRPLDGLLHGGQLLVPVVVPALGHLLGSGTLPVDPVAGAGVEDLAQGTAVLPGLTVDAEEVLPAVGRVRVLGEGPGRSSRRTLELSALVVDLDHGRAALGDLVGPLAAPGDLVVGQPGGAVVPVGLPVLALPEHAAVQLVGEGAVEAGTVGGGDGRLELGPLPALHQVELGALLQSEGGVGVKEAQAIAAELLLCQSVLTVPVLVTAETLHTSQLPRLTFR